MIAHVIELDGEELVLLLAEPDWADQLPETYEQLDTEIEETRAGVEHRRPGMAVPLLGIVYSALLVDADWQEWRGLQAFVGDRRVACPIWPKTYTEGGLSAYSANTNINTRFLFGTPVNVGAGEHFSPIYELEVTVSPATVEQVINPVLDGWWTSAQARIETLAHCFEWINGNGNYYGASPVASNPLFDLEAIGLDGGRQPPRRIPGRLGFDGAARWPRVGTRPHPAHGNRRGHRTAEGALRDRDRPERLGTAAGPHPAQVRRTPVGRDHRVGLRDGHGVGLLHGASGRSWTRTPAA